MFGIDSSELAVVAILALIFIGPKDLPIALARIGRFVGRMRAHARHFTAGVENMMREAELAEMEQKWREQNARIMAQYPGAYADPAALPPPIDASAEELAGSAPPPEPQLPFDAPAAPDADPRPPHARELP